MKTPITPQLIAAATKSSTPRPENVRFCVLLDGSNTRWIESETELSPEELNALFYELQCQEFSPLLEEKLQEINGMVGQHLAQGFKSAALGTPHIYDFNTEDQINLQALLSAGIDAEFRCRGLEESFKTYKPHTKAQLKKVFADGLARKAKILNFYGKEKERLHACDYAGVLQFKAADLETEEAGKEDKLEQEEPTKKPKKLKDPPQVEGEDA